MVSDFSKMTVDYPPYEKKTDVLASVIFLVVVTFEVTILITVPITISALCNTILNEFFSKTAGFFTGILATKKSSTVCRMCINCRWVKVVEYHIWIIRSIASRLYFCIKNNVRKFLAVTNRLLSLSITRPGHFTFGGTDAKVSIKFRKSPKLKHKIKMIPIKFSSLPSLTTVFTQLCPPPQKTSPSN